MWLDKKQFQTFYLAKLLCESDNILLQDYNAKLSDFGLAKDGPEEGKTHVSTRVMGTYGYAAPEYVMTGKYLSKCRCYAFPLIKFFLYLFS